MANGQYDSAVEFLYLGTEITNTVTNFSNCDRCVFDVGANYDGYIPGAIVSLSPSHFLLVLQETDCSRIESRSEIVAFLFIVTFRTGVPQIYRTGVHLSLDS